MKVLILILLISNIYAKDKNIFFDAKIDLPFRGEGSYNNGSGSSETIYSTPRIFLGVSLGYSFRLNYKWLFEPSIGYSFNSGDSLSIMNPKN